MKRFCNLDRGRGQGHETSVCAFIASFENVVINLQQIVVHRPVVWRRECRRTYRSSCRLEIDSELLRPEHLASRWPGRCCIDYTGVWRRVRPRSGWTTSLLHAWAYTYENAKIRKVLSQMLTCVLLTNCGRAKRWWSSLACVLFVSLVTDMKFRIFQYSTIIWLLTKFAWSTAALCFLALIQTKAAGQDHIAYLDTYLCVYYSVQFERWKLIMFVG